MGKKDDIIEAPPITPSTADTIPVATRGRLAVFKQISLKLSKIHDPSLDHFQIKRLNDELNELVKAKREWDFRIRELGGFKQRQDERFEDVGVEGQLVDGYFWFGRAKELEEYKEKTGKKELTEGSEEDKKSKRDLNLRDKLLERVDALYYGYNDPEAEEKLCLAESNTSIPECDYLYLDRPALLPSMKGIDPKGRIEPTPPSPETVKHFLKTRGK